MNPGPWGRGPRFLEVGLLYGSWVLKVRWEGLMLGEHVASVGAKFLGIYLTPVRWVVDLLM